MYCAYYFKYLLSTFNRISLHLPRDIYVNMYRVHYAHSLHALRYLSTFEGLYLYCANYFNRLPGIFKRMNLPKDTYVNMFHVKYVHFLHLCRYLRTFEDLYQAPIQCRCFKHQLAVPNNFDSWSDQHIVNIMTTRSLKKIVSTNKSRLPNFIK